MKLYTLLLILSTFTLNAQNTINIKYKSFSVKFDTIIKEPIKTTYHFRFENLTNTFDRTQFKKDGNIDPNIQLGSKEYKLISDIYDKGHLVPNDDMTFDSLSQIESMYYTNCAPQVSGLNRGVWKQLENYVRLKGKYVDPNDYLTIETGVIFSSKKKSKGVNIPDYFYKIIINKNQKECFILSNKISVTYKNFTELKCNCDKLSLKISK